MDNDIAPARDDVPVKPTFHNPWFVAVWPGMGNVAVNAGIYLLAKLGMHVVAEMTPAACSTSTR